MWHDGRMTPDSPLLADIAAHAARHVGDYLREAFLHPGNIDYKADFHDIVTVHDKEAQHRIVTELLAAAPASLVIGEESASLLSADGPISRDHDDEDAVHWYVDPIDGTANFAAGFDHWCVSIAAAHQGKILAGVLYQPTQDILLRADDTGATKNGKPIHVLDRPVRESLLLTQFPSARFAHSHPEEAARGFLKVLDTFRSLRRPGSTALALGEVASGHCSATFNFGTHPWDVAGGIALVQAAGGVYIGWDGEGNLVDNVVEAPNYVGASSLTSAADILDVLELDELAARVRAQS